MNRRGFFGLLTGAAAGAVIAPQLELPLPFTKTIFLPPAGGWHGDRLLTIELIRREALRVLEMNLEFSALSRAFDPAFLPKVKILSSTIHIAQPLRYASKELVV